jgi:class 3 adenylate cyclase
VDVASWLRELGLERYEAAFRENDVGAEVLCDLTAEDLEGLGVVTIGHRRRLLVAIAALRSEGPSSGDPVQLYSDLPISPTGNSGSSETTAERRPLSVMFCDLIGSTALSSRLDAEDLQEIIRTYQACVTATIQQFDGFIARYVGDGVLIYFGWPEARRPMQNVPCVPASPLPQPSVKNLLAAKRSMFVLALRPDLWSSASSLALAIRANRRRLVRPQTLRHACRAWPGRVRS